MFEYHYKKFKKHIKSSFKIAELENGNVEVESMNKFINVSYARVPANTKHPRVESQSSNRPPVDRAFCKCTSHIADTGYPVTIATWIAY
jgi:hypothetical protein